MDNVKRAQVIMLPTYIKSNIGKEKVRTELRFNSPRHNLYHQHLYIISDDEIKEGDWYLDTISGRVYKQGSMMYSSPTLKKIIATTDTSLKINSELNNDNSIKFQLPQPSQQFIEKFIQAYNKGEVITGVLVEYLDELKDFQNTFKCDTNPHNLENNKLKINPKDNTITIKKLKDSWSREEIEAILQLAEKDLDGCGCGEADIVLKIIRKNL